MFKKPVQRGRSERKSETYFFRYGEDLSDARTKPGEGCVSARLGWVGETVGFFNILLWSFFLLEAPTGAGLARDPDLVDTVRKEVLLELGIQHLQL